MKELQLILQNIQGNPRNRYMLFNAICRQPSVVGLEMVATQYTRNRSVQSGSNIRAI